MGKETTTTTNKYGLKRSIGAKVKRKVRQRCGFGCVNCGNAVYQYEHVDPTFAEAREHNPNHIVLLCGSCHDRVTRGILSKETIKLRSQNPFCKNEGFSRGPFDLGIIEPQITIGTLKCTKVKSLIKINGKDIFSVKPPEIKGGPFRINAYITDKTGTPLLEIVDNEWITSTSNWDVEVVGKNITIRKSLGEIVLSLRSEPPHNLIIERLEMEHLGVKISSREHQNLKVITPSGQTIDSHKMEINGCDIGFDIKNGSMAIGVGGGSTYIENMTYTSIPHLTRKTKIGRNETCPCGSGKKYKKCCGR